MPTGFNQIVDPFYNVLSMILAFKIILFECEGPQDKSPKCENVFSSAKRIISKASVVNWNLMLKV